MVKKTLIILGLIYFVICSIVLADDIEKELSYSYDGPWHIGIGLEGGQVDNGSDFGWGLIVGKEFHKNETASIGVQLHVSDSFMDIDDTDDGLGSKNSTSIFATANIHKADFLTFKVGLITGEIKRPFARSSGLGVNAGIDLTLSSSNNSKFRSPLLSIETGQIDGKRFSTLFINAAIFFIR